MDRPRHRRRDPQRTGPIRNAGEAWREAEPWRDSTRRRDDAASGGVREGYRVIDEQIRRGRRMAQTLGEEGRRAGSFHEERRPRSGRSERDGRREGPDGFRFLTAQMRRTERLAREILHQVGSARPDPWRMAELICRLYVESLGDLAVLGFDALGALAPRWGDRWGDRLDEDVERVERDFEDAGEELAEELEDEFEEELEEDLRDPAWPAAPSVPTTIRATVPIPVYVWSHERTEIDLGLPPGAQSLDLVIEHQVVTGTGHPPHPAFEAELVSLAGGPSILRIEVPRDLPAGRYRRRILIRATGEPVGDLTVQVGTAPEARTP